MAERLIGQLLLGGYLLGDGNYDASYLYDVAATRGYQLVSPVRACKKPGSGKHYQSPYRRRSLALQQGEFGKALYRARTAIERSFGHASCFGGGLGLCQLGCVVKRGCEPGSGPSCRSTPFAFNA